MDIKNIKRIIELMRENELSEFEMEEQGFRIAIKRKNGEPHVMMSSIPSSMMMAHQAPMAMQQAVPAAQPAALPAKEEPAHTINSPIVGTFYRASSPDSEPFISVGQEVHADTVVCIIEAMKVMNEIKAEVSGVIKKILVENATPVQFGQALFEIEPK
ncbi:MAG: acetyl-CoA carboxylase biotin carboxyl carrier protein [Lentisphaerota bacterium]